MRNILIIIEVCVFCLALAVIIALSAAIVTSNDERKEFMAACSTVHVPYECALAWKTGKLPK